MADNEADDELEELDDSVDDYDQNLEYEYDDGIAISDAEDSDEDEANWDSICDDVDGVSGKTDNQVSDDDLVEMEEMDEPDD